MAYIGWDNREYEDPEMDAMREDALEDQRMAEPEAILWHVNTDLPGAGMERRQYHVSIIDGDKRIDTIITYQQWDKKISIEPYVPHEFDYTVHDGCNHEEDECVLDIPGTWEYEELAMQSKHQHAVVSRFPDAERIEIRGKL